MKHRFRALIWRTIAGPWCDAQLWGTGAECRHDAQMRRAGAGHRCGGEVQGTGEEGRCRAQVLCSSVSTSCVFYETAEWGSFGNIPPSIYHTVGRDTAEKQAVCFQGLSILEGEEERRASQ